ncbi:hypothetical protein C7C46_22410 [Streptomyces tateyamensis]|uniref:Uncharacterized protein n=1 Tax=Streptomyces tateyamensis TaxID=565073 RepID=A0A2V4MY53_9ACTN|nr:hypothetical protein [Streptomyces tateyamensis]PYC76395.1 hypothetical protein C7C46_22410 [Streptomyces tateyamensis]
MHDNCQPASSAAAADRLRLAVNALAEFPSRAGSENVAGRTGAVAQLCRAVGTAMDSLVVRTAAGAAEEGRTTGRMRAAGADHHARLQRALAPAQAAPARAEAR